MNLDLFLERIPQGVLLTSAAFPTVEKFFGRWAARLLGCSTLDVWTHPDAFFVHPTNKMRQISVETIRELNRNIWNSPNQVQRKVAVIYEADRLPRSAANAFLKTLEEPPADTSLFLLTTRPYDLLPTLRSRCWWIALPDEKTHELSSEAQQWIEKFKNVAHSFLLNKPMNVMEIYGLLYRFQVLLETETERLQASEKDTEDLEPEEVLAVKAGLEKQWVQHFFTALEHALGEVFKRSHEAEKNYLYPQWMEAIERMFGRTEVNLSPAHALEAFLLNMGTPQQA